jgi:RNA-directed DNA polymerase
VPIPALIQRLNRHLDGWANYFRFGYPRVAFRDINSYVRERLMVHLRRRSQRPFRPPEGRSYYERLNKLGLRYL